MLPYYSFDYPISCKDIIFFSIRLLVLGIICLGRKKVYLFLLLSSYGLRIFLKRFLGCFVVLLRFFEAYGAFRALADFFLFLGQ